MLKLKNDKNKVSISIGNNCNDANTVHNLKDIILSNPNLLIIGYDDYRGKFYAINNKDRVHALILGETGSGKSETLKLFIYHNILRKEGFMLIDPHGMLARDVLTLLRKEYTEEEYNSRVIYINPEVTNYRTHCKTI